MQIGEKKKKARDIRDILVKKSDVKHRKIRVELDIISVTLY